MLVLFSSGTGHSTPTQLCIGIQLEHLAAKGGSAECPPRQLPMCFARCMFKTSGLGYLLALRTAALFDSSGNWTQRLWRYGTVAQLRELLDLAANHSALGARTYALGSTRRLLERDPVIAGRTRGLIFGCLPNTKNIERFVLYSNSYLLLHEAVNSLEEEYIQLWIDFITNAGEDTAPSSINLDVDLCSWLIGSHLRNSGLSDTWIINHCYYELRRKANPSSMANILEVADRVIRQEEGLYQFLIPLELSAHINSRTGPPWLSRAAFTARFNEVFPTVEVPPNAGGLELEIMALDKYTAQSAALKKLLQTEMRVSLSSNKRRFVHENEAWMHPGSLKVDLSVRPRAEFRVRVLDADGGRLLFHRLSSEIEAALDLLTGITSGSERVACVGAWSALESLLADPGDFGNLSEVADRAADILVCCYVTDIFVNLATASMRGTPDQLSASLVGKTDEERISIIESHLQSGGAISAGEGMGAVVADQVARLVRSPGAVEDLHADISAALRRLYQARNEIVHAGALEPYGIDMILISAQVLLSRLINKAIVVSRHPGDAVGLLAAKAHWSLQRTQDRQSLSLLGTV